jgi:hypothetical protein
MALLDDVRKIAGVAERLKGPVGNEANTKALLIEPTLAALGWDTTNLDHVLRDWPMHENSSIDYALRIGDDNVMFIEARGVNENLDDPSFTARAVDGASGEGVLWCAVTNGLVYRVYRTDELVPTEQKLAFEVDLSRAAVGSPVDTANVPLLSRESLGDGSLALWGEQKVFTDPRVRDVLAALATNPSAAFLDAINEAIGEHKVPRDRLRSSLGRVLVIETPPGARAPAAPRDPEPPPRPRDVPPTPTPTPAPEASVTFTRPEAPAPARPEAPPAPARPDDLPRAVEAPPRPVEAPPRPEPQRAPEPPRTPEPPRPPEVARTPEITEAPPESSETSDAPDTAQAAETREQAPSPETAARRRFLGVSRGSRDSSGGSQPDAAPADPYAPLARPDGPFDEVDF